MSGAFSAMTTPVCIPRSASPDIPEHLVFSSAAASGPPIFQVLGYELVSLKTGSSSSAGFASFLLRAGHMVGTSEPLKEHLMTLGGLDMRPSCQKSLPLVQPGLMISFILEEAASVPSLLEPGKGRVL